jgi:oxygen-dependent protoporphyrinogen oxidase
MQTYDCVVVGAGVSGVSSAYTLFKRGLNVLLTEAGAEVGGAIRSIVTPEGYVLDCGPNTLASKDPRLWSDYVDMGLADRMIGAQRWSKKRYVLLNGKPEQIFSSPVDFVRSPLLSTKAKLRMLAEPFIPRGHSENESVFDFFTRRLGPEPTARLIDPFFSAVYAGDPWAMEIRSAMESVWQAERRGGSIVRGMLKRPKPPADKPRGPKMRSITFNFRHGLAEWPNAIARVLGPDRVWCKSRLNRLQPAGEGWQLLLDRDGVPETVETRSVILAVPADVAGTLVADLDPATGEALQSVPYAPVSTVHLGYRSEQLTGNIDGFGILAPSSERREFLGLLLSSSLFRSHAPQGKVLTITMTGGALAPHNALRSHDELIAAARRTNELILGAQGEPELAHATRWERAIPQYVHGHHERMALVEQLEQARPGLFFTGSYRGGVGVPKCWANSVAMADQVALYLEQHPVAVAAGA